tara:strand:- start:212 stop:391 length:180 start_codon:yes stop_codon:yes gene_type:complete
MRGFLWVNLTVVLLIGVALNFPTLRIEVAKVLANTSEFLFDSVDKNNFYMDYWFKKLNN